MSCTIHREENGLHWIFRDEVTDSELLAICMKLYDDPRLSDIQYIIVNYLAVTQYNVTSDTIFKIGQMDEVVSQKHPHLKIATISTSQLFKGVTRMWELSGGTAVWESRIFEEETAAREWLNG